MTIQLQLLVTQETPEEKRPRDITRNRHRGNTESEAANGRANFSKSEDRWRLMCFLRAVGPHTSKELSQELKMGYTTVSARLSELKAMQLIEKTGERREGAAVVRVK